MKKYALPVAVAAVVTAGVVGVAITMEKNVVTVNGTGISKETVDEHMASIPANLMDGQEAAIRQSIIERLVEQELVMQDATAKNVEADADYVKAMENLKRNFTYNYMLQKEVGERLSEDKLREIYEANKENFKQPTVKARHILVATEAEAKALITKLNNGADFAKTAETESTGPSAKNGGDLGYFKPGDMVPEFSEAAFALEAGQIGQTPVKTQFGWHVIKVEDKKVADAPTFEMMMPVLREQLTQGTVQSYIADLKEAATIEYTNKPVTADVETEAESTSK